MAAGLVVGRKVVRTVLFLKDSLIKGPGLVTVRPGLVMVRPGLVTVRPGFRYGTAGVGTAYLPLKIIYICMSLRIGCVYIQFIVFMYWLCVYSVYCIYVLCFLVYL